LFFDEVLMFNQICDSLFIINVSNSVFKILVLYIGGGFKVHLPNWSHVTLDMLFVVESCVSKSSAMVLSVLCGTLCVLESCNSMFDQIHKSGMVLNFVCRFLYFCGKKVSSACFVAYEYLVGCGSKFTI